MRGKRQLRRPRLLSLFFTSIHIFSVLGVALAGKSLYDILGVSKTCTPAELKKAYRKQCLRHHPDKGGDVNAFKEVSRAYDILADDTKRNLYDQYGEAAVSGNGAVPPNAHQQPGRASTSNPFSSFGNQGGGFRYEQSSSTGMPNFFEMGGGINAEDLFRGAGRTQNQQTGGGFNLDLSELLRQMMAGQQGRSGGFTAGGRQTGSTQNPFAPRTQQYTRPCPCTLEELATGATKKLKVNFPSSGARVYTIKLQKGWKAGTKIKFNASKDGRFPPITFVVQEKKHACLQRRGDDVIYRYDLSKSSKQNADDTSAVKLELTLPDGEVWTKTLSKSSSFLRKGQTLTVTGKGMPIKGGPDRGNLIVEFYDSSGSGNSSSNSYSSQQRQHRSAS